MKRYTAIEAADASELNRGSAPDWYLATDVQQLARECLPLIEQHLHMAYSIGLTRPEIGKLVGSLRALLQDQET